MSFFSSLELVFRLDKRERDGGKGGINFVYILFKRFEG